MLTALLVNPADAPNIVEFLPYSQQKLSVHLFVISVMRQVHDHNSGIVICKQVGVLLHVPTEVHACLDTVSPSKGSCSVTPIFL